MATPTPTPTTNDRKRKRDLSVSTSGFTPLNDGEYKDLPYSLGECVHMQKQKSESENPFHSDNEEGKDPKSPHYSPYPEYDCKDDEKTIFRGFSYVGKNDDSEQNDAEESEEEDEIKWIQHIAALMLPDIKYRIPNQVMRAFWEFEDILDDRGECFNLRKNFEEFWLGFGCYLEREEQYDTLKMDENKQLKKEIKKNFKILATRYDDEKRCENLGKFLRSFDALNDHEDDDEEKIEFNEKNLLNHFRLEKQNEMMYRDVKETDVEKLFQKLSKVRKR